MGGFQRFLHQVIVILCLSVAACSGDSDQLEVLAPAPVQAGDTRVAMDVFKSPTCGCCGDWIEHMEHAQFSFTVHHPQDLNRIKDERNIKPLYQSCHTAVSKEGYVFEGHIPAKYVRQFLESPPQDALGLSVPGMPLGSPGMEMDDRFTPYQVLLLKNDGTAGVYAEVLTPAEQY